jgi:hypothetical protein
MPFRIHGFDLVSGRPCAPYESGASSEDEAHAEAGRLGIRVESLESIADLDARERAAEVALTAWDWPELHWRSSRWALLRLGFEHPRWSRVLYAAMLVSSLLVRTKVVPAMLAVLLGAGLAAFGLRTDPELLLVGLMVASLFVPFLVAKPWVFAWLRHLHAPDGFDRERRFSVRDGELRWFDGTRETALPAGEIQRVHELSHSILISLRHAREIAIPTAAFANAAWARRFAARLAASAGVPVHLGFRSAWQGEKPEHGPMQRLLLMLLAFVFLALFLVVLLVFVFR